MRAMLIAGDGVEVAFIPFKGTFDELQTLFDCNVIEIMSTPIPGLIMLVDEDARLTKRPTNHKAMLFYPGSVFGPAVLTYFREIPGEEEDERDIEFTGIPEGFDFKCVAESSYQRICASLGEHPLIELEGT